MAEQGGTKTEIGTRTRVVGDVQAEEDVFVLGRVEGTVASTASVVIEEGGIVLGQVQAAFVVIAGRLEGAAVAEQRLEVTETGTVLGDLYAPALVMQDGAAVRGRVAMDGSRPEGRPAVAPTTRGTRPSTTPQGVAGTARRPGTPARPTTPSTPGRTSRTAAARTEPPRERALPLEGVTEEP